MADMGNNNIKISADVSDALAGINSLGGSLDLLAVKLGTLGHLSKSEFGRIGEAIQQAGGHPYAFNDPNNAQGGGRTAAQLQGFHSYEILDALKEIADILRTAHTTNPSGHSAGTEHKPPHTPPAPTHHWPDANHATGQAIYETGAHMHLRDRSMHNHPHHQHPGFHLPGHHDPGHDQRHQEMMNALRGLGTSAFQGASGGIPGMGQLASVAPHILAGHPIGAGVTALAAMAVAPTVIGYGKGIEQYAERHQQEAGYAQRVGLDISLMEQGQHYGHFAAKGIKPTVANELMEEARQAAIDLQQLDQSISVSKALGIDKHKMVDMSGKAAFDMRYGDMRQFGADMRAESLAMGGITANRTPEYMQMQLSMASTFANTFGQHFEGENRDTAVGMSRLLQNDPYYRDNLFAQQRVLQGMNQGSLSASPRGDYGRFTHLRRLGVSAEDAILGVQQKDYPMVLQNLEQLVDQQSAGASPEERAAMRAHMYRETFNGDPVRAREMMKMADQLEKNDWKLPGREKGDTKFIDEQEQEYKDSKIGQYDRTMAENEVAYLKGADNVMEMWIKTVQSNTASFGKLDGAVADATSALQDFVVNGPASLGRATNKAIRGDHEGAKAELDKAKDQFNPFNNPQRPRVKPKDDKEESKHDHHDDHGGHAPHPTPGPDRVPFKHDWSDGWRGKLESAADKHGVSAAALEQIKTYETWTAEKDFPVGDKKYGGSYGPFQYLEKVHGRIPDEKQAELAAKQLRQRFDRLKKDAAAKGWDVSDEKLLEMAVTGHNASALGSLSGVNEIRDKFYGLGPAQSWADVEATAHRLTDGGVGGKGSYWSRARDTITADMAAEMGGHHTPGRGQRGRDRRLDGLGAAMPTKGPITSGYGHRDHPVTGEKGKMHYGIDIGAKTGAAVNAPVDGKVVMSHYEDGYGNLVVLEHEGGWRSAYAHLSERDVKVGAQVKAGQEIGNVGSTGRSTGPHLHYEVKDPDGNYMNPLNAPWHQKPKPRQAPPGVKADPKLTERQKQETRTRPEPQSSRGEIPRAPGFMPSGNPLDGLFDGGGISSIGKDIPGMDQLGSVGIGGGLGALILGGAAVLTGGFNPNAKSPSVELEDKNADRRAWRETAENTRDMRDQLRSQSSYTYENAQTPGINPNARRDHDHNGVARGKAEEKSMFSAFGKIGELFEKIMKGPTAAADHGAGVVGGTDVVQGGLSKAQDVLQKGRDWAQHIPGLGKWVDKAQGAYDTATGALGRVGPGLGYMDWGMQAAHGMGLLPDSMKDLPTAFGTGFSIIKKGLGEVFSGRAKNVNSIEDPDERDATNGLLRSQAIGDFRSAAAFAKQLEDLKGKRQVGDPKAARTVRGPNGNPSPTWGVNPPKTDNLVYDEHGMVKGVKPKLQLPDASARPKVSMGNVAAHQGLGPQRAYTANVTNNVNFNGQTPQGEDEMARIRAAVANGTYQGMQEHERRFSRDYAT